MFALCEENDVGQVQVSVGIYKEDLTWSEWSLKALFEVTCVSRGNWPRKARQGGKIHEGSDGKIKEDRSKHIQEGNHEDLVMGQKQGVEEIVKISEILHLIKKEKTTRVYSQDICIHKS